MRYSIPNFNRIVSKPSEISIPNFNSTNWRHEWRFFFFTNKLTPDNGRPCGRVLTTHPWQRRALKTHPWQRKKSWKIGKKKNHGTKSWKIATKQKSWNKIMENWNKKKIMENWFILLTPDNGGPCGRVLSHGDDKLARSEYWLICLPLHLSEIII